MNASLHPPNTMPESRITTLQCDAFAVMHCRHVQRTRTSCLRSRARGSMHRNSAMHRPKIPTKKVSL
jgi:hypothetical protein